MTAEERVESLTAERRQAWLSGLTTHGIELRLEQAWSDLRAERAARANGRSDEIIRRARVERELEKLMAGEEDE